MNRGHRARRVGALKTSRSRMALGLVAIACLLALATAAHASARHPRGHALCDHRTPLHRHKVFRGEIGYGIAGLYGVTLEDLKKLNPKDARTPIRSAGYGADRLS